MVWGQGVRVLISAHGGSYIELEVKLPQPPVYFVALRWGIAVNESMAAIEWVAEARHQGGQERGRSRLVFPSCHGEPWLVSCPAAEMCKIWNIYTKYIGYTKHVCTNITLCSKMHVGV